jgi:hypothetical protein
MPPIPPDNPTRQQHFVAQTEQRLNALNPGAAPENQRIYEMEIIDRDRHMVRLTSLRGRSIARSLSMFDLYSFDVGDDGLRANFEEAFNRYEGRIEPLTRRILGAHAARDANVSQELFDLFVAKMVNFVRNPYSVVKVLNSFPAMAAHHPARPETYAAYERILTGRRPQQAHLCTELGISDEQYGAWLRIIFMLLMPMAEGVPVMLEQALGNMFENRRDALVIHVNAYTTERCLLSDRGVTSPIEQNPHTVFDFNLAARAFIRYAFLDFNALTGRPIPPGILAGLHMGPKVVRVEYNTDDLASLDVFHRRVIEQSFRSAFCSGPEAYSVTVLRDP